MFDKTVDRLDSPAERFAPNPQLTGKDGGSSLNLHQLALDGVTLLGRLQDAEGSMLSIGSDLMDNLAAADKPDAEIRKAIDGYIEKNGLQLPQEDHSPRLQAGYDCEVITELDLNAAGITTIIWATGYRADFSWIHFPIFDEYGYPVYQRGVTAQAGLYFVGLLWLHNLKSSLLYGMGDDAEHIATQIASRSNDGEKPGSLKDSQYSF